MTILVNDNDILRWGNREAVDKDVGEVLYNHNNPKSRQVLIHSSAQ